MTRELILEEIRRVASELGKPPGRGAFQSYTGIPQSQIVGVHWRTWGDALRDAGFDANVLQERVTDEYIIERVVLLAREIGYFPKSVDRRMKKRSDQTFPTNSRIERINRNELIDRVIAYCKAHSDYDDVIAMAEAAPKIEKRTSAEVAASAPDVQGHVYLIRAGRDSYKIGKTNSPHRRHREVAINVPHKTELVHTIASDDPRGIELYWHRRFEDQRISGTEFFKLRPADIAAFKRRRFM